MKTATLALAFAVSCLLAASAHAQQPQPGLWQVTAKSSGMGGPPRDHTSTSCITPEQTKNLQSGFGPPENPQMPCKRTNYQQQGNKVTFNVQCTMPNATSEGTGTFIFDTPTHYTATMTNSINMQGQKITTTTNIEGRRIGECPAK